MARRPCASPFAVVAALLALCSPAQAGAVNVFYSTIFRAYDYFDAGGDRVRSRTLSPSITLLASDLLGQDLSFRANARRVDEFEGFSGDEDHRSDLLYGVLTWRDRGGRTTLAAGRQVLAQGPGYMVFDGLAASWKLGRAELSGALGIGFERDGRKRAGGRYERLGLRLRPARIVTLGGAIERGTADGLRVLLKESVDALIEPSGSLAFRGSFIWNGAVGEMDEALASAEVKLGAAGVLAEVARIHPHFDPTTIWNVFNSGPYNRAALRIRHPVGERGELWTRYERRTYWHEWGNNAGRATAPNRSVSDTLSLGFGSGGARGLRYSAELFYLGGYGGSRAGTALRIGRHLGFLPGRFDVGLDLRAYDRGVRDSRQDLTTAWWAEAALELSRHARLTLKGEDYHNGFLRNGFRVTVKLDLASEEWFQ